MHIHYLPREQVNGYMRDLADRLLNLGRLSPTVCCPVGRSGSGLLNVLTDVAPELNKRL